MQYLTRESVHDYFYDVSRVSGFVSFPFEKLSTSTSSSDSALGLKTFKTEDPDLDRSRGPLLHPHRFPWQEEPPSLVRMYLLTSYVLTCHFDAD